MRRDSYLGDFDYTQPNRQDYRIDWPMRTQFDLQRFLDAQAKVYADVCEELHRGRKRSHWMWFIFPQIKGLGHSETARYFAIDSLAEAQAFLSHPVLGHRLRECSRFVLAIEGQSAEEIFGSPDNLKFHSSMTLFAAADPQDPAFKECLIKYFLGEPDPATLLQL